MKRNAAPLIIVILLLLLPMLYVASYFALVLPGGYIRTPAPWETNINANTLVSNDYRIGGVWSRQFYWPLELVHRRLRPVGYGQPEPIEP